MLKNYPFLRKFSVVAFFLSLFAFSAFGQKRDLQTDLNNSFIKYDLIRLDKQAARRSVENGQALTIAASEKNFDLILTPRDLRSPRYKAEDASAVGVREIEKSVVNTFKGTVSGESDSEARLTIDGAKIEGFFEAGGERFFIEPARRYSRLAGADDLVVYRERDFLKTDIAICPMNEKIEQGKGIVAQNMASRTEALRVIEIATDADFQYLSIFGGNPTAANAEILSILNMAEGVYERELGLTFSVVYQHTWTTGDPFTGTDRPTLLTSFQNYWNTNFPTTQIPRDAAHLFTARGFALGGGYALIGVICRRPAESYGLSGYIDWAPAKFLITAHEIGHNLGANHNDSIECKDTLMNTQLSGATQLSFCSSSRAEITSYVNANSGCLSNLSLTKFDFDGDSKTDLSIYRPVFGEWWYLRSTDGQNRAFQFGDSNDRIVPADYTGDGKTDVAIFRPSNGNWYILRSEDFSYYSYPFGTGTDIAAPGDFDGDGKADTAVFRPSETNWYIRRSSDGGTTIQQFGASNDVPVVADYDGDSKADIAIFRPVNGQWWVSRSASGVIAYTFGERSDKPVPADFTGDGKADVAIFRPASGEWFILRSEDSSYYSFPFGANGDVPAPGDYDGDGRTDATVFRPVSSTWFVQRTSAGTLIQIFGLLGDRPVPAAYVP
jgi:hypothetical protein